MNYYCIIPVYNSESKVAHLFENITKQSIFKNVNFIIIDDGSTDNTYKEIQNYSKPYSNITLLNKENGGAGSARNCGLKYISTLPAGLVTFLDFDDDFDNILLETLKNLLEESDADIVISSLKKCFSNKEQVLTPNNVKENTLYDNEEISLLFVQEKIFPCSMAKLYKTELWKDVLFDEDCIIGEDSPAVFEVILKSKKVLCTNYCGYYADRKDENVSLTKKSPVNPKYFSLMRSDFIINELIKEKGFGDDFLISHSYVFTSNFLSLVPALNYPLSKNEKLLLNFYKKYINKNVLKYFKPKQKKLKIKKVLYKIFGLKIYSKIVRIIK